MPTEYLLHKYLLSTSRYIFQLSTRVRFVYSNCIPCLPLSFPESHSQGIQSNCLRHKALSNSIILSTWSSPKNLHQKRHLTLAIHLSAEVILQDFPKESTAFISLCLHSLDSLWFNIPSMHLCKVIMQQQHRNEQCQTHHHRQSHQQYTTKAYNDETK